MCQYCEFQGSATNKENRKRADFLDGSHEKFELFLHPTIDDDSDYHFWIVGNSISDSIDSLAVKFCPMCGRDLTVVDQKSHPSLVGGMHCPQINI